MIVELSLHEMQSIKKTALSMLFKNHNKPIYKDLTIFTSYSDSYDVSLTLSACKWHNVNCRKAELQGSTTKK